MKTGIDGGALSITDDRLKMGVYRVAHNLVKELPLIDVKSNYRVYRFGRGEKGTQLSSRSNIKFVRLPRYGFQKIWQPFELISNPVDVYLGISQSLPITLYDVKKIGFIYDVGFLDHPEYYRKSHFDLTAQTANVVRRSDHMITISQASANNILKKYHIPKEKLTVAYLGVEKQFMSAGPKYRRAHPYFLFVGAFKPGKNVPMMLRSFACFLENTKGPCDFLLAGSDYWLDPEIPATINALRLRDRVQFVGFLDDETLATYYRGAAALVTVSLIEGFGLPAVEAMACGTPVIASTIGSFPEVVGEAGILIDPHDEESLAKALRRVVNDATFRTKLINGGKRRVKQFTWKNFARIVYETSRQSVGNV
ncbi:glycosyltransferase family 4 protein [Patescibacteria group bacterium]|nr:glycosyltransferase family 4 protein [Patescibacteria group bacterium]MBU1472817.1 glycosyltransferase family 4 protein [Patescibacteria group bacterium]MBU2460375.1 glycosyltransferase family 4 protein [Patescibacteria group bacterium]MBU2544047.1 glycosyltransferase family 4 protein [Patescibacteria group bacterium]